jgi:hypothetical protein
MSCKILLRIILSSADNNSQFSATASGRQVMIIVAAYDGSYKDNRKRQYLSKTVLTPLGKNGIQLNSIPNMADGEFGCLP